jgi:hypothetical protein
MPEPREFFTNVEAARAARASLIRDGYAYQLLLAWALVAVGPVPGTRPRGWRAHSPAHPRRARARPAAPVGRLAASCHPLMPPWAGGRPTSPGPASASPGQRDDQPKPLPRGFLTSSRRVSMVDRDRPLWGEMEASGGRAANPRASATRRRV